MLPLKLFYVSSNSRVIGYLTLIFSICLLDLLFILTASKTTFAKTEEILPKEHLKILKMDVHQLLETEILVTSVSRKPQELHKTASAVFVITQEDIRRIGAVNIMEALRIAPGLQVSKTNQNTYTISIRGFNQQSGADKLLVLIDGRSIYSPGFSTVFWLGQDVVLEDVDRIEVIRGPGAAIWGSNAVAGVINIITKNSDETQGNLLAGGAGTEERGFVTYRYGDKLENGLSYRAYGKYRDRDDGVDSNGDEAFDEKQQGQIGFRADWKKNEKDYFTIQGDTYYVDSETDYPSVFISNSDGNRAVQAGLIQKGSNFLTRWTRDFEDESGFKLQLYYDRFTRDAQKIVQNTVQKFDLDFQHDLAHGERNEISWGFNYQYAAYDFGGNVLEIETEDSHLFGLFVHDEISLVPETWSLILGSKFEHNKFSGFEVQPNIRVLWTPNDKHSYWAAVSRAVRIPSPRDEDATVNIFSSGGSNPSTILREEDGSTDAENLLAYEVGYKFKQNSKLHLDIATFWFDYTDLVHPISSDGLITRNINSFEGIIYGFEFALSWEAMKNWRLSGNYSLTQTELNATNNDIKTNAFDAEDEPKHRIVVNSFFNLSEDVQFDINYYFVSKYKAKAIKDIHRLDLRLGWSPSEKIDLSLIGQNVADARHQEFSGAFEAASETQRSFYAKATFRF